VKAKEGAGKATDLLPRRPKPSQDGRNLEGPANPTRADGSTSVDANRIAARTSERSVPTGDAAIAKRKKFPKVSRKSCGRSLKAGSKSPKGK
jgi:hypothetical protein